MLRHLTSAAPLKASRAADAVTLAELEAGTALQMLDCSLGWAWGYAGKDRMVGYVAADKVGA